MNADKMMERAKVGLVMDHPFWGSLALHLKLKADPTCKTAWVDGRTLGYNPAFIESLTNDRVKAVWAHEVEHCALGHPWRRDARDARRWNIACDKPINQDLRDAGFRLPDGVLYPTNDEVGKSAEWIFARMPAPQPSGNKGGKGEGKKDQQQAGPGQGDPGDGDAQQGSDDDAGDPLGELRDAPTEQDDDGTPAPTEQDWKERAASAAIQAKMMGHLPAGAERNVGQALKPRVDVKALLLRFFSERTNADYTWRRPNIRFIAQGMYMPALDSKSLGEVAIMVDTSGSMDAVSLNYARGIVQDVLDECDPLATTLYFADAKVCNVRRLEKGEPLDWKPKGGGGTDFRPALAQIEEDGTPSCVVCITDLYGTFPEVPPSVPVLWLSSTENKTAPFGETVYVDR